MIAEYKTKTNIGVGLGVSAQWIGRGLFDLAKAPSDYDMVILGFLIILAGAVLFIWGCRNYAMGKGYSAAYGFLGLLSCFGLLVLVLMKDKHPNG